MPFEASNVIRIILPAILKLLLRLEFKSGRLSPNNKIKLMVHCIEVQYISVPAVQCKSLEALLQLAAKQLSKNSADLKAYFVDAAQRATLMESDSDLLSLKYVSKEKSYKFKVEICKSKLQMENEMRSEAVEEYLASTYDSIVDAEIERQLKKISEEYLQELYAQIAREEEKAMIARIEKEEVSSYIAKMSSHMIKSQVLPRGALPQRITSRKMRVSPEGRERRQSMVEKLVGRVLEEMMPQMVKDLSSRIMDELRFTKLSGFSIDFDENPEEL